MTEKTQNTLFIASVASIIIGVGFGAKGMGSILFKQKTDAVKKEIRNDYIACGVLVIGGLIAMMSLPSGEGGN